MFGLVFFFLPYLAYDMNFQLFFVPLKVFCVSFKGKSHEQYHKGIKVMFYYSLGWFHKGRVGEVVASLHVSLVQYAKSSDLK